MADLSVKIGGLKLKNPVMTASGTFGYGLEFATAWASRTRASTISAATSTRR